MGPLLRASRGAHARIPDNPEVAVGDRVGQLPGEFFKVNAQAQVPAPKPLPLLVAALAPVMLKTAGTMTDGTITWMVGPKTLETHIVPRLTQPGSRAWRAAGGLRPAGGGLGRRGGGPRAGRTRLRDLRTPFNYQRMLEKEGVSGPAEVAVVGNEVTVEARIRELASAGATEFVAGEFPVGNDPEASIARTRALLRASSARSNPPDVAERLGTPPGSAGAPPTFRSSGTRRPSTAVWWPASGSRALQAGVFGVAWEGLEDEVPATSRTRLEDDHVFLPLAHGASVRRRSLLVTRYPPRGVL